MIHRTISVLFVLLLSVLSAHADTSTSGTNSPIIQETQGDVNINYNNMESKKDIPSFSGQIAPFINNDNSSNGEKFNDFMLEHEGNIVYIDISPYYDGSVNFDKPKIITVPNNPDISYEGGNEYIIKSSTEDDFFYDPRLSSRRISGYFKVLGISGPQQGYMSVVLKPIDIPQ